MITKFIIFKKYVKEGNKYFEQQKLIFNGVMENFSQSEKDWSYDSIIKNYGQFIKKANQKTPLTYCREITTVILASNNLKLLLKA